MPTQPPSGGKSPALVLGLLALPQDDLPDAELDGDIFGETEDGSGETEGGSGSDFCARLGTLTGSFGLDVADALSADVLYEFDPAYLDGYRQLPPPEEIAEEFPVSVTFVDQVISGTAYPLSDVSEPTDAVRAYIDANC